MFEALFRLGLENHICFGIELAGEEIAGHEVRLDVRREPALKLVRSLLETTGHYEAVERGGVILIRDRRVRGHKLLDYRLHTFQVERAPVQTISNVLRMSLVRQIRPEVRGFAGHYRSGEVADTVGPFAEAGRTVRELLNLVITESQGGAWVASGAGIEEGSLPKEPYWEILQFSSPMEENLSRLRILARELAK